MKAKSPRPRTGSIKSLFKPSRATNKFPENDRFREDRPAIQGMFQDAGQWLFKFSLALPFSQAQAANKTAWSYEHVRRNPRARPEGLSRDQHIQRAIPSAALYCVMRIRELKRAEKDSSAEERKIELYQVLYQKYFHEPLSVDSSLVDQIIADPMATYEKAYQPFSKEEMRILRDAFSEAQIWRSRLGHYAASGSEEQRQSMEISTRHSVLRNAPRARLNDIDNAILVQQGLFDAIAQQQYLADYAHGPAFAFESLRRVDAYRQMLRDRYDTTDPPEGVIGPLTWPTSKKWLSPPSA